MTMPNCSRMAARRSWAREAVRLALVNLDAVDAPAGSMPVVLGQAGPACCCTKRSVTAWKATSTARARRRSRVRIGQRVAAPGVTVVDDGTLQGRRGSLNVDDEGVPTESTVLIEDGILRRLHAGQLNARLMGTALHRQWPARILRASADAAHDEHLHARGPARSCGNHRVGQAAVCTRSISAADRSTSPTASFTFSASEAYLIEDGKITRPVKGATLIGYGSRRDESHQHDRQRPAPRRRRRRLRQGRPERAGRRGSAAAFRIDGITVGGTAA